MAQIQPEVLCFDTIAEVDGGAVQVAFDHALQQIIHDLRDRPTVDKPRTIALQLSVSPVADRGHLSRADIEFQIAIKVPARKTVPIPFRDGREGLQFFPDIRDNPDQRPLPFDPN